MSEVSGPLGSGLAALVAGFFTGPLGAFGVGLAASAPIPAGVTAAMIAAIYIDPMLGITIGAVTAALAVGFVLGMFRDRPGWLDRLVGASPHSRLVEGLYDALAAAEDRADDLAGRLAVAQSVRVRVTEYSDPPARQLAAPR